MRDVLHDLRGSVGSIRLAITGVLDDGDDASFREVMLSSADEEARRLAAALGAVPALMTSAGELGSSELASLIAEAADRARAEGVDVEVHGDVSTDRVLASSGGGLTLGRILVLLAGATSRVRVDVASEGGSTSVRLCGDELRPMARRLSSLLIAGHFGANAVLDDDTVAWSMPLVADVP